MSHIAHTGVWIPFTGRRKPGEYEKALLRHVKDTQSLHGAHLLLAGHGGDPYRIFGRERTVTLRSDRVPPGGPVFTHYPSDKVLVKAVDRARGTMLAVLSSNYPSVEGWASAVGAHNLLTGEPTPPVDDDSRELFSALVDAGYQGGYNTRDSYIMAMVRPALTGLVRKKHDADFIVTYGIACGLNDQHALDLRKLIAR